MTRGLDWCRSGSRGGFNEAAEGPDNGEARRIAGRAGDEIGRAHV